MASKRDPFVRAIDDLVASTSDRDISQILSIIKAGTENKSKRKKQCISKFAKRKDALEHLISRLPNDEDNMNLILSILADICFISQPACEAVGRFDLLEHLDKILKSRQHDDIIINSCLELIDHFCINEHLSNIVAKSENNLNIIESIVRIQYLNLEEDVPSKTTLMLPLCTLYRIFNAHVSLQSIVKDYGIVKVLGCMMIKFIDDWKTSEKNHDSLATVMKMLEKCSQFNCENLCCELKNTGRGDAMLLLSDLIVIPEVSFNVSKIVVNLLRRCIHYSDVPVDDIFGRVIEKVQDLNVYTHGTENYKYVNFLRILCELSRATNLTENVIVNVTVPLLNALQNHVQPTTISFTNCELIIETLIKDHFTCSLRLMLDNEILSMLLSKLDWIFDVENQLDLYHESTLMHNLDFENEMRQLSQDLEEVFEHQFYGNLNTPHAELKAKNPRRGRNFILSLSPVSSMASTSDTSDQETDDEALNYMSDNMSSEYSDQETDDEALNYMSDNMSSEYSDLEENELPPQPKRAKYMTRVHSTWRYRILASRIVDLIECFADMQPTAPELGTSDIVYKLLLFFMPKNDSIKPKRIYKIIKNIIRIPERLINLLKQTEFVYSAYKLFIPMHNIRCVKCVYLFAIGHMIMKELTKVVESTIEKGDIAHNLFTASPTVKEALVVALPFFSEKMSTLNNLMIKCGGLDMLIDAFRRETAQRGYIVCSLNVLAQKIKIKDPTDCTDNLDFDDNNDEVTTVLEIENYQLNAGHIVTFKLDDDSCVQADRELLASKSDFFNSLLFGQFKESHEEVVRLPETSHNSFKLVLMLLQLDDIATGDKLCRNHGKLLERVDLAIVLEAIVLCDRFSLKELSMSLILFVRHCKFAPTTALIIYRRLVDLLANTLRMEVISYCLVGCMSVEQRNCLFEELLKSETSERLVDDLKTIFRRFLCAS